MFDAMYYLLLGVGFLASGAALIIGSMKLWRYAHLPKTEQNRQKQWEQLFSVLFSLMLLIWFLQMAFM